MTPPDPLWAYTADDPPPQRNEVIELLRQILEQLQQINSEVQHATPHWVGGPR